MADINATPNPVVLSGGKLTLALHPVAPPEMKTSITWETGLDGRAKVFLKRNGGAEERFDNQPPHRHTQMSAA